MSSELPALPGDVPILEAIQWVQPLFHGTTSVGRHPYWDDFLIPNEVFDEPLEMACQVRSVEGLSLCETLEDLLGEVYERWEDIQKVRFCQALIQVPSFRRRRMGGDQAPPDLMQSKALLGKIKPVP